MGVVVTILKGDSLDIADVIKGWCLESKRMGIKAMKLISNGGRPFISACASSPRDYRYVVGIADDGAAALHFFKVLPWGLLNERGESNILVHRPKF
jgi:hypothetical protein